MHHLPAFLAIATVAIVTPGPDTALTVRNTLLGGRAAGMSTAVGVISGQLVWALATSAGVATLLSASQPAFLALRTCGALYLIYLGIQSIRAARRGGETGALRGGDKGRLALRLAWRQGLLSDLGNPKIAVLLTSLLPQFGGRSGFTGMFALGLVFAAMTVVWLCAYAFAMAQASAILRRHRIRQALEAITGGALVALGLRLATERAPS